MSDLFDTAHMADLRMGEFTCICHFLDFILNFLSNTLYLILGAISFNFEMRNLTI